MPSLTSSSFDKPLTDTRPILEYIDAQKPNTTPLAPTDPAAKDKVESVLDLVHDEKLSTNIILLFARDDEEMQAKQAAVWKDFVVNRQQELKRFAAEQKGHPFYEPKLEGNTPIFEIYTTDINDNEKALKDFYHNSHDAYRGFAEGLTNLNDAIVLPYIVSATLATISSLRAADR